MSKIKTLVKNHQINCVFNFAGDFSINFLAATILASCLVMSCAKPIDSALKSKANTTKASGQSIVGGTKVDDTSILSRKVLYLALGVQMKKLAGGGFSVAQSAQCTGFALSPNVIATAAHCLDGLTEKEVYLILGKNPLLEKTIRLKNWIVAKRIKIHPQYLTHAASANSNPANSEADFDLALIELSKPIDTGFVSEILTHSEILNSTKSFTMIGYGLRSGDKNLTRLEKKSVNNELYSITKVAEPFSENDHSIYVDQKSGQGGICSGDSGGPGYIYDQKTDTFYVAGILSGYASTDNTKNCVGVAKYTSIIQPDVKSWINKAISEWTLD